MVDITGKLSQIVHIIFFCLSSVFEARFGLIKIVYQRLPLSKWLHGSYSSQISGINQELRNSFPDTGMSREFYKNH